MSPLSCRYIVALMAILSLPFGALTQPDHSIKVQAIDLENVLKLSGANNLTIKEFDERQALAHAEVIKAESWWLPGVYAGLQTHALWGAAMNTDGRFSLETNRDNLWAGLGIDVNWDVADGVYNTRAAKHQLQAQEYKSSLERNKAILKSIEAYYDLLETQLQYASYQELINQSDSLARQIDVLVLAGLSYESESLLAKSNAANIQIMALRARMDMAMNSAELGKLLNIDPSVKLLAVDSVMLPVQMVDELLNEDLESVYQRRPELKILEYEGKALESKRKKYTTGLAIPSLRLDVFQAYVGGIDGSVEALRPDQFPVTQQLYSTQRINASLLWNIPLSTLVKKGDIKAYDAKLRLGQIQIDQQKAEINNEVQVAKEASKLAKEEIQISSRASSLAQEALHQSLQRQQLGTVRPFEILQAQEVYITSRLNYIKAVTKYNISQYQLYVAIGNNL